MTTRAVGATGTDVMEGIAIIDAGKIVGEGTPEQLKADVAKDRVQLRTKDDIAAIVALKTKFDVEAEVHDGQLSFGVASGEEFLPHRVPGAGDRAEPAG